MNRSRHSSMDCMSSYSLEHIDEWQDFLSTSLYALSTTDDENHENRTRNAVLQHELPNRSRLQSRTSTIGHKARCNSNVESLTSSSGSSPIATTNNWLPLGERLSSVFTDTSSISTNEQVETKKENQETSFDQNVPNSILTTSSSSSTSSQPSLSDDDNNPSSPSFQKTIEKEIDSHVTDIDTTPIMVRSTSTDSKHSLGGTLMHARSPVIGNHRDSATWSLQDEEFLPNQPFGGSLRVVPPPPSLDRSTSLSLHPSGARTSSGRTRMSHRFSSVHLEDDEDIDSFDTSSSHSVTKGLRASSMDMSFGFQENMNPPLPPSEPLTHRSRARSFSHSSAFTHGPFLRSQSTQQPQQQYQSTPQQLQQRRSLHSYTMSPPQIHIPTVRPPRVTIPSDSPMHHYSSQSSAVNPQTRRYVPESYHLQQYGPNADQMQAPKPAVPQQALPSQVQQHQAPNPSLSRGIRSQSMENFLFPPHREVRSQSMEMGLSFPSSMEMNSQSMQYDWHSPPPTSQAIPPPLPPDTHEGSTSASFNRYGSYSQSFPEAYYEVEFKRGRIELFAGNANMQIGAYVKVEADRGEDIGRVAKQVDINQILSANQNSTSTNGHGPELRTRSISIDEGSTRALKSLELPTKKILSIATSRECDLLNEQRMEEREVYEVCKNKVIQRLLPMNVIDAEYQFDRHKLTFFFEAERRIDFRELVRDLFAIYKTRIWLQQVVPHGKKPVLHTGDFDLCQ